MTSIELALKPDFSQFVSRGKLDVLDAMENHLGYSEVFLNGAIAILEDIPSAVSSLEFIKAYRESVSRGIEEAYRLKDGKGKAA